MLEMPRRSVTRFFIPLIDVLTLLFCIFLMMPAVKKTTEAEVGATAPQGREDGRVGAARTRGRTEGTAASRGP